ncbi:MAG: hypothetical protein JW915_04475 [Chitinispirillaceae bacterium]|nr:hypothetical protein [Chitinispirillaceae bacterium]
MMYQKTTDIYATSINYSPVAETTVLFIRKCKN